MIALTIDDARVTLARTPAVVRAMLDGLPEPWVREPEPGGWSAFDVVGHLIAGEETDWIPRARVIIDHGESRAFEPFDREGMFAASRGKSLAELLDRFEELRARNLAELATIAPADLERRGLHPDLGPVTLSQLLATWVTHDHAHIAQIARILARHYGDAVGPWKAYLGVLKSA